MAFGCRLTKLSVPMADLIDQYMSVAEGDSVKEDIRGYQKQASVEDSGYNRSDENCR